MLEGVEARSVSVGELTHWSSHPAWFPGRTLSRPSPRSQLGPCSQLGPAVAHGGAEVPSPVPSRQTA